MTASDGQTAGVSSRLRKNLSESTSLLGALDAISRWKPFLVMVATLVSCVVAVAVFSAITGAIARHSGNFAIAAGLVFGLITFAIALVGVNAAGILLADDAWDREQRSIVDALIASAFTSHRLILVFLLTGLAFLAYLVVLALILFLCKIPGIGPLLYAVVLPVAVIITGTIVFALFSVVTPLAAPAVWNGATVMQTLAMLKVVVQKKLPFVFIMMLLLGLLLGIVTGIISAIFGSGLGITLSLSAALLGSSAGGLPNMAGMFSGQGLGDVSGYIWAAGFGGAILFLAAITPGALVGMKGASLIYRTAIADLSIDSVTAELNDRFEKLKQQASDAKQRALEAGQRAMQQPEAKPVEPQKPAEEPKLPPALQCPSCNSAIGADDAFCGNCGHRLK